MTTGSPGAASANASASAMPDISGLLGMNVGGIPLANHPNGFFGVVLVMLTFTGVAGWLAFRNRD